MTNINTYNPRRRKMVGPFAAFYFKEVERDIEEVTGLMETTAEKC